MNDYQATLSYYPTAPGQWANVQKFAAIASESCILELRTRVEALEAAAHKHIVETSANILALASRVEALEAAKRQASKVLNVSDLPQWTPEQAQQIADLLTLNPSATLTSYNYPAKPDSSLVKRVALAISGIEYGLERDEEAANWASEARAAIREVAAWMHDNNVGYNAVKWLELELK
jgi:hypothetical protein